MKIKQIEIKWKCNCSLLAVDAPKVMNRPVFMFRCSSLTKWWEDKNYPHQLTSIINRANKTAVKKQIRKKFKQKGHKDFNHGYLLPVNYRSQPEWTKFDNNSWRGCIKGIEEDAQREWDRRSKRAKGLHPVGFEPTHSKILELESSPLDQLGQRCDAKINQNYNTQLLLCMSYLFYFTKCL